MRSNIVRYVLTCLMLLAMALFIASPALAETEFSHELEGPAVSGVPLSAIPLEAENVQALDLDQMVKGNPLKLENLNADNTEYLDSSIHAVVNHDVVQFKDKKGKQKLNCYIVRITIADPTQIRSAMSYDDYDNTKRVKAAEMATAANAVAAVNGDFFKYFHDSGYIVRQGKFYRDKSNGQRDVLLIDSEGDFHVVYCADSASIQQAAEAFPEGVTLINSFNLGPVLIENGEVQDIKSSAVALAKKSGDQFQYPYRMQRVAIVQLGKLQYAIVECNGKADASSGMSIQDFADYIKDLFPDALVAYNLDGGGSTNVIFPKSVTKKGSQMIRFERIHKNSDAREISDIIYFASAEE
ncbi:MAG: phosphodiester glycosidase family protein [Clostridiales bacterium]|nr:phosphodiester glycosidase family protein [Clostridia bacterium]MCR4883433.1 phosphodiester glycosidase family protein [Clostridiales bacterium]